MKTKNVYAIIEASKTGFGIYAEDDSLPLTSYGVTIEEAKEDLKSVLEEMLNYYKEKGQDIPAAYNNGNLKFVFKYDIASIFEHFGVLDATQFAKKIGMNASLLRQYKTGHALASDKQKHKIEAGLHALGRELLNVRL
jgi:predicted RNase H-like HicB family nuclease